MLTIEEIGVGLGVNIPQEYKNIEITNISTDTRTIKKGDFYLPLKGEKFDGEKFVSQAVESGAVAYVYTQEENKVEGAFGIKVSDTKEAYLKLANYYRKKLSPKVIMITGSSGKTTTKELVYSVVSQKYNTVRTPLNHNNDSRRVYLLILSILKALSFDFLLLYMY